MPSVAKVWTEERVSRLQELTEQGLSSTKIGKVMGRPFGAINHAKRKFGFCIGRTDLWPQDKIETLKRLWSEGKSGSVIAAEMGGITRNAVIGKAHRLGLPTRNVVERRPVNNNRGKTYKRRERRMTMQHGPTGMRVFQFVNVGSDLPATHADKPCSLIDLPANGCRWPCEGEGFNTVFCGGDRHESLSYCARHCRMAYR